MDNLEAFTNQFANDGVVVVEELIPQELLLELRSQIEEISDVVLREKNQDLARFSHLDEKYYFIKEHYPILKSHFYDCVRHCDALWRVATHTPALELLRAVAQTAMLIDHVIVRIDDKTNEWLSPFHQEGYGQISLESVNMWIPLQEVGPEVGSLQFIRGSHKQGWVKHRFYPEYQNKHGVVEELIDRSKIEIVELNLGGGVIFDSRLFHASSPKGGNTDVRWTFVGRYNPLRDVAYLRDENAPMHTEQVVEQ